jgi:hypothetical protein
VFRNQATVIPFVAVICLLISTQTNLFHLDLGERIGILVTSEKDCSLFSKDSHWQVSLSLGPRTSVANSGSGDSSL